VARLLRVDDREDRAAGERDAVDRHDLVADAEQAGGSRAWGREAAGRSEGAAEERGGRGEERQQGRR